MSSKSSKTEAPAAPVVAGRVRRPHGVRGEVLVEVLSVAPHRFAAGARLWLEPFSDGTEGRWLTVESSRPGPGSGRRILRFAIVVQRSE